MFIDEGEVDMRQAMDVYRDNRFNGPYMVDHMPAIGYIRALVEVVYG